MIADHVIDKVHQILILDGDLAPKLLPPLIQTNIDSIRETFPHADYKLWSSHEIEVFLSHHFDLDVTWAYGTLKPYSYKSDLARFCILYVFGGMYIDLGVRLMGSWRIPLSYGISAFRDARFVSGSWSAMQTGLLWARPGREEFGQAIRWIVENCRNQYYGSNPLYPTGPVLLGRAFILAMAKKGQSEEADDQQVGDCRRVTPDSKMENVSYVSREGMVVALRTKRLAGDLAHLGLMDGNNYNQLWNSRQVYGEHDQVWPWSDSRILPEKGVVKTKTGLAAKRLLSGPVSHGPYVDLAEGSYDFEIALSSKAKFTRAMLELTARCGAEIVFQSPEFSRHDEREETIKISFALDEPKSEVEFRFTVFGEFEGEIVAFKISRVPVRTWRHDHKKIQAPGLKHTVEGLHIPLGTKGQVVYGPYVVIDPGIYDLQMNFSSRTAYAKLDADVCINQGNKILQTYRSESPTLTRHTDAVFRFQTFKRYTDVEFRLSVFGDFEGDFMSFCLRPVPSPGTPLLERTDINLLPTLTHAGI